MKIVLVVEEFDPEKGYLEYYLARELSKLGHKVIIFSFNNLPFPTRFVSKEGFTIVRLSRLGVLGGQSLPSIQGFLYIIAFIKHEKPDVIHCQPLSTPLSLIFVLLKRIYNYKVLGSIMTQLNLVFSPWGLRKKFFFSLSKISLCFSNKQIDAFFAKNEALAKVLATSYRIPVKRFYLIPLGSDLYTYKLDLKARINLRKTLKFSSDDVVLVYSGKLDYTKGLDILLKAMAPLVGGAYSVKLLIIGKGSSSYLKFLENLVEQLKIEKNVLFYPWVNKKELPSLYSASDIGVWPGLSSISIVDAAACSLPLIIARYPVEIFAIKNGNGYAFEIGNINELRSYLLLLINNKGLREEMANKSRLLVERELNWFTIATKYLKVYKLVGEKLNE